MTIFRGRVTLCRDEMRTIFALILPQVARWRAFYLKVCANECKLIARQALSTCGPAPRLETLQLYHLEDYRTAQNLYLATYRAPVVIFDNVLPALKNVSLIGVNLPWAHAPYLQQLYALELALHTDSIRPPYEAWGAMLRRSTHLRQLRLHYSGPREAVDADAGSRICVPTLEELSLTDLDPDHLTRLLRTLELPRLTTLALDLPQQDDLPDQDFTGVVELIAGRAALPSAPAPAPPLPIAALHTLRITALECAPAALRGLLRALAALRVLELDFARVRDPDAVCDVLFESTLGLVRGGGEACACAAPVLPRLEEARLFGLRGERLWKLLAFRARFAEGCRCAASEGSEGSEDPPSSVSARSSPSPSPSGGPIKSAPRLALAPDSQGSGYESGAGRVAMPRFTVRWSARRCGRDAVLDRLVDTGRVAWVDEDSDEADDYDASEGGEEEDDAEQARGGVEDGTENFAGGEGER
ncbi:hypothetical protein B0H15DRAFT_826684 [Mycena belliarum]|uniref:Uncharacterized protein n=1 Tax=Mycena belliarum TaxID=1033014 RepID=A0AAD6UG72_9AGAR|nr:hypothetical protein B0H15DRAFT_826684 [Mycena belliae]